MPTIRTLAAPLRHEIPKVRGSRFIASIAPTPSPEAARGFLEERRTEFRNATHNCFAWRLGSDAQSFRHGDDGEPSGTAGRPILREIDGRGLTDLVVVVTRYFGGTKLGTGGLARAYGGAAGAALDQAQILEIPELVTLRLRYPYELTSQVQSALNALSLELADAAYGAEVQARLEVPTERAERVADAIREAGAGRIEVRSAISSAPSHASLRKHPR